MRPTTILLCGRSKEGVEEEEEKTTLLTPACLSRK
jgi:hypothetical protein